MSSPTPQSKTQPYTKTEHNSNPSQPIRPDQHDNDPRLTSSAHAWPLFSSQRSIVRCLSHSLTLHRMLLFSCSSIAYVSLLSFSLPRSLSLCLSVFTRGRGLTFTSAHVLVRALVDGPSFPPTDKVDCTPMRSCALMPTLAVRPPHVCHRQRDWAVSIGSHMQLDMDIFKAPPRPGAPSPVQKTVNVRNLELQIGDNFP